MVEPNGRKEVKKARRGRVPRVKVIELDKEIWKNLPEDLLEGHILPRLPMAAYYRFHLVCKKWMSLLDSPKFLQQFAEAAQHKLPCFFAWDCGEDVKTGSFYDLSVKKWCHTSSFPPLLNNLSLKAFSAGGLIGYPNNREKVFHVGNPFTQTWKTLPWSATTTDCLNMKPTSDAAVGMVVPNNYYAHSNEGCKIIVMDTRGRYEVYDSLNPDTSGPSGTTIGIIRDDIVLPSYFTCSPVSIDNVVYFLGSDPHGIVSYDFTDESWGQIHISSPPNSTNLSIAECNGHLLLLGLVKNPIDSTLCVHVWGLQIKPMVMLTEVDRMPASYCSEFTKKDGIYFTCLGNKRLLVMSLRNNRIFTYDAVSREWSKIPRYSKADPNNRYPRINRVGFFPCLSASP